MTTTLKDRFQQLLSERPDLKQSDLARATGATPPSVNGWVHGKILTIRFDHGIKAAEIFGVNPVWLCNGHGPKYPSELADATWVSQSNMGQAADALQTLRVLHSLVPKEKRSDALLAAMHAVTAYISTDSSPTNPAPASPSQAENKRGEFQTLEAKQNTHSG